MSKQFDVNKLMQQAQQMQSDLLGGLGLPPGLGG